MDEELTPRQAAERIGATTRSVQRWIAQGTLPARRVGGRWRVASGAIDALAVGEAWAGRGLGGEPDPAPEPDPAQGPNPALRPTDAPLPTTVGPIRTLFVANRGEIAARIRRTADRLGIQVVIPGEDGQPLIDLLDIGRVTEAALAAGADALHPGFGFLSENADFAEAVEATAIRWVGPPSSAIRAMGNKAAARRLATSLGIPVVPGYDGDDQSDAALLTAAREIAGSATGPAGRRGAAPHPVLIKPAAGGGGKGMHVVLELDPPGAFLEAVAAARREATAGFGDPRLILERFLAGPRHVEVQLLFDAHGGGVHLGERDCSLQRRHQKILEESPSPAVDEPLRRRLGRAALNLAAAVGYRSAGTCEFLLDDNGEFHFLEMNTRLQVEHPVTELVTGRDLVADQLRIAAGEPLGFDQQEADEARRNGGHAVEVRLYAEDPDAGFLPSTGRVEALRWPAIRTSKPALGPIRVDSGIGLGSVVDTRFDPMLAKVIAGSATRDLALANLAEALDQTVILGLVTNLNFLRWLVVQPVVIAGDARINTLAAIWPLIADDFGDANARATKTGNADLWQAAARALVGRTAGGWRLNGPARIRLERDGVERTVALSDAADPGDAAGPGEDPGNAAGPSVDPTVGTPEPLVVVDAGGTAFVDDDGRSVPFRIAPPPDIDRALRAAAAHTTGGPVEVMSPMPGSVLKVHVGTGEPVDGGQPLVTLEAMKMEHVVTAPSPGVVIEVLVQPGGQVARGDRLIALGPPARDALP